MSIKVNEWLEELERLSQRSDDGQTAEELSKSIGRSTKWVRSMLLEAKRNGWLRVGERTIKSLTGRTIRVPVYSVHSMVGKTSTKHAGWEASTTTLKQ